MSASVLNISRPDGLSQEQVNSLQQQFGKNVFRAAKQYRLARLLLNIAREPMFILLIIACAIYFILGEFNEGFMMAVAMAFVAAISIYQDVKSSKALEALKQFTEPKVTVIRDGVETTVRQEELVPGDILLLEEGMRIPADAFVISSNDLYVNESVITGESVSVQKIVAPGNNQLYQGTTIESGKCIAEVMATGNNTTLGKIGKAVMEYDYPKTQLQMNLNKLVRKLALFGLMGFFIILLANYLRSHDFITGLLFALTLALAAIPEEIPVAFSFFMAIGAYKLSRYGIISRSPQIIENLGTTTVLCLDKTGTITENRMQLKFLYDHKEDNVTDAQQAPKEYDSLLLCALLASESNPFDAMERAIVETCRSNGILEESPYYKMVYEYPLEGQPPMMTHVYLDKQQHYLIAAKGAPERILKAAGLDGPAYDKIMLQVKKFGQDGYRVLAVAKASMDSGSFPEKQDGFKWQFIGLLALYDPPKSNAGEVISNIRAAGIDVKILTGDFSATTMNIARQVHIETSGGYMDGQAVMAADENQLKTLVSETSIFTRMFPDAKLKVINALKSNGAVVAMTGDGINDAPALKASDIGIAMGKRGTETARRAADLIITDDNLDKLTLAIREGRKIFNNLSKGVRYIISIHIPIVLTAVLPVLLSWKYPNIFTPIHVIFLELIMGPTCSIFFENEPAEHDLMRMRPRNRTSSLFTTDELLISIAQGLLVAIGVLSIYFFFMKAGYSLTQTRTMVFVTLILANIFLTFTARSFTHTIFKTIRYKNNLVPLVLSVSIGFLATILLVPPVRNLFELSSLSLNQFLLALAIAIISVGWFEVYKMDLMNKDRRAVY